jgi:hypothetical protein
MEGPFFEDLPVGCLERFRDDFGFLVNGFSVYINLFLKDIPSIGPFILDWLDREKYYLPFVKQQLRHNLA